MKNFRAFTTSVKDRIPNELREVLKDINRRARYIGLLVKFKNADAPKYCSVCDRPVASFVHGGKLCAFCASFPRHRALWPLIKIWLHGGERRLDVLHAAPEKCLRKPFLKCDVHYIGLDKFEPGHYYHPSTIEGDLTSLQFPDSYFDLVVALHILEHIENDKAALKEMFRVLRPGGVALLAFPFRDNTPTYEDPTIVNPDARAAAFGQRDHVRFYGEDVLDRIADASFKVRKVRAGELWDASKVEQWALNPDEVFFICTRPGAASPLHSYAMNE